VIAEDRVKRRLTPPKAWTLFLAGLLLGVLLFGVALPLLVPGWTGGAASSSAFDRPYPLPNRYWAESDEFYVFASGGQQGGLYVYSIPAMKYLAEIPIFSADAAWGWTPEDPKVKRMLTNPWSEKLSLRGDTRRPALSRTDAVYDGRWIFVNDMIHPRIARVDLDTFRAGQVLWIPNVNGGVDSIHVSPNTSLIGASFEHGQFPDADILEHLRLEADTLEGPYLGGFAGIAVDDSGAMSNAWQVWTPWTHDAIRVGWGLSDGWIATTSYNSERANATLAMLGSDQDFLMFWNLDSIKRAVASGDYAVTEQAPNVPVINWNDVEAFLIPVPVNPSGVDISPTGKYVLVGSKASSQLIAVDFAKALAAAEDGRFDGQLSGLPVLGLETISAAIVELGLGPTQVEFDDRGYAYIGSFVDSVTWKMTLGDPYTEQHGETPWEVVETLSTHYSIVNPLVPGGDTAQPYGQYLIAINKLSKNSFIPHGPLHAENHELFSIRSTPARLIDQMPIGPETHAAQAIPVEMLAPRITTAYEPAGDKEMPRVEYDYEEKEVRVYMDVVRSFFDPDWFTVPEGWRVSIQMTSLEQAPDISHGLAIDGYDVAVSLDPGEVRQIEFIADQTGVHWFYCLWYCSELHKEMRGRMIVIPEAEWSSQLEMQE
jgi:nitrous-oxide reductase